MAAQYKHLLSVFLPLLGLLLYPVWCLPSVAPSTFTFNIFPKDGNDIAQETAINQTLAGFKIDPKSILFFKYAGFGVFMWKAPLTQDQATNLRSQSAVSGVYESCRDDGTCPKDAPELADARRRRKTTVYTQKTNQPFTELKFVSQANGADMQALDGYAYDTNMGMNELVYIIDTGADLTHDDFFNIRNRAAWLYPRRDLLNIPGEGTNTGHGTCMLSKIGGQMAGVASAITPIVVRVPSTGEGGDGSLDFVLGFLEVWRDYKARKAAGTVDPMRGAVVNFSSNIKGPTADFPLATANLMKNVINQLIDLGVFVVTGSGNTGAPVDGYPALFPGDANDPLTDLMVIGGVNNNGVNWGGSQTAAWVTIGAPGVAVWCAQKADPRAYRPSTGTSDSSAMVAGLAAYFKSIPALAPRLRLNDATATGRQRVQALKSYIEGLAYRRRGAGNNALKGIWNGIDSRDFGLADTEELNETETNFDPSQIPLSADGNGLEL